MLENLFNSKLKKKLLGIFFYFPKRSFSVSELREQTGATTRFLNQALKELVRAQAVNAAAKGVKRYYGINRHFRWFDELHDLAYDPDFEVHDEVSERVKRIPNLKLALITGIFTAQPQLPADMLLVGAKVNRPRLQRVVADLERLTGSEINYILLTPEEYEYRRMMNDRFVRDILDYPHLVIFNNLKKS